jgi:hypothetical protein
MSLHRHRARRAGLASSVLLVSAAASLLALPVSAATCVSDPASVAAADVAFVGTLTSTSAAGDQVTLAVQEVWSAGDLPAAVGVNGVPGQWSGMTAGSYLVLATVVDGGLRIGVGECDIAIPWDASYAALRPASAHAPTGRQAEGGVPVQLFFVIGVAAILAAVSAVAFRRTRDLAEQERRG